MNSRFQNATILYASTSSALFSPSPFVLKNFVGKECTDALSLFSKQIQSDLAADICHLNMYSSFGKFNCKNFAAVIIFRIYT